MGRRLKCGVGWRFLVLWSYLFPSGCHLTTFEKHLVLFPDDVDQLADSSISPCSAVSAVALEANHDNPLWPRFLKAEKKWKGCVVDMGETMGDDKEVLTFDPKGCLVEMMLTGVVVEYERRTVRFDASNRRIVSNRYIKKKDDTEERELATEVLAVDKRGRVESRGRLDGDGKYLAEYKFKYDSEMRLTHIGLADGNETVGAADFGVDGRSISGFSSGNLFEVQLSAADVAEREILQEYSQQAGGYVRQWSLRERRSSSDMRLISRVLRIPVGSEDLVVAWSFRYDSHGRLSGVSQKRTYDGKSILYPLNVECE